MPGLELAIRTSRVRQGEQEFRRATDSVQRQARGTDRSIGTLDRRMDGLGRTASRIRGSILALFGGLTAGVAIRSGVQTIASFEETLATVGAVARATDADLVRLTDTARTFGATTRFTATEAGEGLLFLSRTGFSVEESIAALGPSLDLATAGALGLGEAADFASNILQQFGLDAEQTARVADVLIGASNRANTDVRQLASALSFAGPVASTLGISIEQSAAAIGALSDAGIQAERAGTGLRQILLTLLRPTRSAQEALKSVGLTIEDVNPATVEFTTILERLKQVADDPQAFANLFPARTFAPAQILTQSIDKIDELTLSLQGAGGEAAAQARVINDTLGGSLRNLRSATEAFVLSIGDSGAAASLRSFVDVATGGFRILAGMEDLLEGNTTNAQRFAASLELIAKTLAVIVGLGTVGFFIRLAGALTAAATSAVALGSSLTLVSSAITGILSLELGRYLANEFKFIAIASQGAVFAINTQFDFLRITFTSIVDSLADEWQSLLKFIVTATLETVRTITNTLSPLAQAGASLLPQGLSELVASGAASLRSNVNTLADIAPLLVGGREQVNFDPGETRRELRNALGKNLEILNNSLDEIDRDFATPERQNDTLIAKLIGLNVDPAAAAADVTQKIEDVVNSVNIDERLAAIGIEAEDLLPSEEVDKLKTLAQQIEFEVFPERQVAEEKARVMELFELGFIDEDVFRGKVKLLNDELRKIGDEGVTAFDRILDALEGWSRQISQTFADFVVTGTASFEDLANSFVSTFVQIAAQELIVAPIVGAFSSALTGGSGGLLSALFSAQGNAFSNGNVVPFASGGVIGGPTMFPLGIAGEAGPEAILPLTRTQSGDLGVATTGGGGVTVIMNITTPNADSFRQSRRQITDSISGIVRSAQGA